MEASSHWRAWVAVGVVLLLALGTALWLRSDRPQRNAVSSGATDGAPIRPDVALSEALDAVPDTTANSARTTVVDTPRPPLGVAAATEDSAPGEIRIEVVDAATDAPVANAVIVYRDLGVGAPVDERDAVSNLAEIDALVLRGTPLERTTDEAGIALLPAPRGPAVAIAREGERFGYTSRSEGSQEPLRIEIARDWSLAIRVVDGAGRGVPGVPVALRQRWTAGGWDPIVVRTEGPDGIGRVPHAGSYIGRSSGNGSWRAAVAVPLREPLEREIDPASPPDAPLQFVLPATGSVVVELFDVDGGAYLGLAGVALDSAAAQLGVPHDAVAARARSREGKAIFPFVELGLDLTVSASRARGGPGKASATLRGPTTSGETASVALRFGLTSPVLAGRLVHPDGTAVAGRELPATLRGKESLSTFRVFSGPEGRFWIELSPPIARLPDLVLTVSDRASGESTSGVAIPANLPTGLHDLGDLVLGAAPLIAEGTVADPSGAPIAGAALGVHVRQGGEPLASADGAWRRVNEHSATSDAEGRFALYGTVDRARPILVTARRHGFAPTGLECAVGASGLRIALARGGAIEGRILLDDGVPTDRLRVEVQHASWSETAGAWELRRSTSTRPDAGGRYVLRDLPAGAYTLRVTAHEVLAEDMASIDGLVVAPGEVCDDRRSAEIDLRGLVSALTLRIVDREGRRVPEGLVSVFPSGTGNRRQLPFDNGEIQLLRTGSPLDVTISALHFRFAALKDLASDREVVLQPGYRVRIVLAQPFPDLARPYRVAAQLMALGDPGAMLFSPLSYFDERGEAVLDAPAAGQSQVYWFVRLGDASSSRNVSIPAETPSVIDVAEVEGEQTFEVELDAKALTRAVEQGDD